MKMNLFVNFIIESGISISVLGVLYYLFLRKETFFLQNRIFLFMSVVFSLVLPFLHFRIYEPQVVQLPELIITPDDNFFKILATYGQGVSQGLEQTVSSTQIILWIYAVGVLFFLLRFLYKWLQIYQLINRNRENVQIVSGVRIVRLDRKMIPFSFLNTIFIPYDLDNHEGYSQILLHEMEHVKQRHSYDILILELLIIVQWCNPFVWLLKRAVHENHEYLADKAVLAAGTQRGQYKLLLLNQCLGETIFIGSPFNYSLIKNRIKMMNKIKSHKIANIKYLLGIFIGIGLVVAFALENRLAANEVQLPKLNDDKVTAEVKDGTLKFKGEVEKIKEVLKVLSTVHSDNEIVNMKINKETNVAEAVFESSNNRDNEKKEKDLVFIKVEKMPQFPGGDKALLQFINRNVRYPEAAAKQGIQGKVYLKFVVKKDGKVGKVVVTRSPDKLLTAEAMRIVKLLPDFQPGMQRGKPVDVWYNVPLTFRLSEPTKTPNEEK